MAPIKQLVVGGFRGVLSPLTLPFVKGKTPRSLVIYGRNGTGKSSITDAWEWFHTEKIVHLAREGAGPSSYPHVSAQAGETYVEVQFANDDLGKIRLDFDPKRITMPAASGNIANFRAIAPHPCHIRFEDLTRFVYLTKADKYDALAQLMGFTTQVDFQKALKRVLRSLSDRLETLERDVDQLESDLSACLSLTAVDDKSVLKSLNQLLARHSIGPVASTEELRSASKTLTTLVEKDPGSQELSDLRALRKAIEGTQLPDGLGRNLLSYIKLAEALKQEERDAVDLLLVNLYEQGLDVLTHRREQGLETKNCPLCGKPFEGDLLDHISAELSSLQELKQSRDALEKKRRQTQKLLMPLSAFSKSLQDLWQEIEPVAKQWPIASLIAHLDEVEKTLDQLRDALQVEPENITTEVVKLMQSGRQSLLLQVGKLETLQKELLHQTTERVQILEQDTSRAQLVTDHTKVLSALELWGRWTVVHTQLIGLQKVHRGFQIAVDDYIHSSTDNVQKRFDTVSSDVQTYFEILEERTEGLGQPVLKLLPDQDRAVVLQVEFRGEPVYPAYRYLSESQLNSFGLAVFLASAKHFNPDFRFLILDDVINSFDVYKRPQVITLLKQEFSDHQVLLLTHDSVWCDQLSEKCPSWVQYRFIRLEPGSGPVVMEGVSPLEEIERLINEDKPVSAGRDMGPFLERQLQQLCESFGVMVKYNQRNEYTLDPLLDRFCVRVRRKLGTNHKLYKAVKALQEESGFRNICAHWKDPESPITMQEMLAVVEKWKAIDELVRCKRCHVFLQYDGRSGFVCSSCNITRLQKA